MAAEVKIQVGHGAAPDWTDVGSATRFKLADNDVVDLNDPLLVLSSAITINGASTDTTLSYQKTFRVVVTAAAVGELSNLRFFRSAGSNVGISEFYGFANDYVEATGNLEGNNVSGAVSAAALVAMVNAPARVTNGEGPFIGTGQFGNMIVVQWHITPTAVAGVQSDVIYSFRYDEV